MTPIVSKKSEVLAMRFLMMGNVFLSTMVVEAKA